MALLIMNCQSVEEQWHNEMVGVAGSASSEGSNGHSTKRISPHCADPIQRHA
jgi:hypothetical protein